MAIISSDNQAFVSILYLKAKLIVVILHFDGRVLGWTQKIFNIASSKQSTLVQRYISTTLSFTFSRKKLFMTLEIF